MLSSGKIYGRILVATILSVLSHAVASAQETDDYMRYKIDADEEARVAVESDTLLFYRAVQQSRDLFDEITAYRFSNMAFARRGMSYTERTSALDGIEVRRSDLSILRRLGLSEHRYSGVARGRDVMGGMAGADEFTTTEGVPLPSVNIGVFFSGRGYLGGARATVNAVMRRGWSMSAYVAGRGGDDLYVKGVYNDGVDGGLRLTKEFSSGGVFSVVGAVAVSERGLRSGSVREAFELTGDRMYNPSWGRQEGRVRNSRVRRDGEPLVMASYSAEAWGHTSYTVSAGGRFGLRRYSSLGWYDAMTPVPDNYRYLPSFFADGSAAAVAGEEWRRGNEDYTQINWTELYRENRLSARGAVYALDDRVERTAHAEAAVRFRTELGQDLTISYGVRGSWDAPRRYRQMRDMLGAAYLVDLDYYLVDDDTYSNKLQNDLRRPDRRIGDGDRFSYDYSLVDRRLSADARFEYRSDRWYVDVATEIGSEAVFRRGYYEKELFAGDGSYGRSSTERFTPYGVKVGAGYIFSPKHYLGAAAFAASKSPDAEDLFLNPQYNNRMVDDRGAEKRWGVEANYRYSSPTAVMVMTLYAASTRDARRTFRAYDDLSDEYCDVDVSRIGTLSYGAELASEVRLTQRLRADFAVSAGRYIYSENPLVTHYRDTDNEVVSLLSESYMGDCAVGGAPQLCGTAAITYLDYKGWAATCSVQAVAARYVDPSFVRRTERVARQAAMSEEMYGRFVDRQRLDDAVTVDASVSRWFRAGRSRIVATLSVRNLLGDRDIVRSGYESSRIRRRTVGAQTVYTPHEDIVTYAYPRTYYCVLSWKF